MTLAEGPTLVEAARHKAASGIHFRSVTASFTDPPGPLQVRYRSVTGAVQVRYRSVTASDAALSQPPASRHLRHSTGARMMVELKPNPTAYTLPLFQFEQSGPFYHATRKGADRTTGNQSGRDTPLRWSPLRWGWKSCRAWTSRPASMHWEYLCGFRFQPCACICSARYRLQDH